MPGSPSTANPLCPRPDFRLATGQGYVNVPDLEDWKTLPDRLDGAKSSEERRQSVGENTVNLEVDIFRRTAQQSIAHPAADDKRAAAGIADRARDFGRECNW